MSSFPTNRLRRLRENPALRGLARETRLSVSDFVYPLFVTHGTGVRNEIDPMPGQYQISLDILKVEARDAFELGVPALLLFGIPVSKDGVGSEAYARDGIVQNAIRTIKDAVPEMAVIGDVCLCEYTDHGHCGVIENGHVDNDGSLELLARTAVAQAEAGVDIVAPSAMMDGQVGAIRAALDDSGFADLPIMGYSAKYASAFYGPFRAAAESTPQFGDRRGYQMDSANVRQAMMEIAQDLEEGADIVMVKPALAYLDVIAAAREKYSAPVAAYNVSGEYSMLKAASANEWLEERTAALEMLTSIKRAGADILITYFAKDAARWLNGGG